MSTVDNDSTPWKTGTRSKSDRMLMGKPDMMHNSVTSGIGRQDSERFGRILDTRNKFQDAQVQG